MSAIDVTVYAPPAELLRDEPEEHLVLAGSQGNVGARCSLWWRHTPQAGGQRVGAIGHFSASEAESGARLLKAACARLALRGCRLAVGPMDGNTWRRYRLVVERGDEPAFFLEPDNPAHWPEAFGRAGFSVMATYCSSAQEDVAFTDARVPAVERRAAKADIRIRHFNLNRAERDLLALHSVVVSAFQRSFLFTPIGEVQFLKQYRAILPHVRPELVLIAEQQETPVAFLFAIPDLLDPAARTVILKTVAVRPSLAYSGLGHLLVAHGARAAGELGYRRAVHALMHEANGSLRWSERYGRVFRRYALFGKAL